MTIILQDGFEYANWPLGPWGTPQTSNGSASIVADPYTGLNSALFQVAGLANILGYARIQTPAVAGLSEVYARAMVRINSGLPLPVGNDDRFLLIRLNDALGNYLLSVGIRGSSFYVVGKSGTPLQSRQYGGSVPALGSWFLLEAHLAITPAGGTIEIFVNGTRVIQVFVPEDPVAPWTTIYGNVTSALFGITTRYGTVTSTYNLSLNMDDCTLETPDLVLTINSTPITGVPFTINGQTTQTPYASVLASGSYTIVMPNVVGDHHFVQWNDGDTNPVKTIDLLTGLSLTATYEYVAPGPGKIDCTAYFEGNAIVASVAISGVGTFATPFSVDVPAGARNLTATYQGVSKTQTVIVVSGQTTTVRFDFSTSLPFTVRTSVPAQIPYRIEKS